MGRIEEQIYDDWQVEAIERVTGEDVVVTNWGVVIEHTLSIWHPSGECTAVFQYDGTRDGFQRAYLEWARANTAIEPPF